MKPVIHRLALANELLSTECELCMGRSFVETIPIFHRSRDPEDMFGCPDLE
jgi:hypothetical protein